MTYDRFVEACNVGRACPACFTTCAWFIRRVVDSAHKPFHCEGCGHRFSRHEYVDHVEAA